MNLSIIIPCFNEEKAITNFYIEIQKIQKLIDHTIEYIFVDDGSTDSSLQMIRELSLKDSNVKYLSFSRNFGKEAAIYAGLKNATGSLVALMDVDLQDPPELLPQMINMIKNNKVDSVCTRRSDRNGESIIRSVFSRVFYKLMNRISNVNMLSGVRDYRLMTRQMVDAVLKLSEKNRFSKGIFSWIGFNTEYISYENIERKSGTTSWSFFQLIRYAINGILSFSESPLHIATGSGIVFSGLSIIGIVWIVIRKLISPEIAINGWSSVICLILLIGGIQLMCIGILGEYIGKIFIETKDRPIYIVKETDNNHFREE